MCLSCDCGWPAEDHGDPRHITLDDLTSAVLAAGTPVERAAQNIVRTLADATGAGSDPLTKSASRPALKEPMAHTTDLTYVSFPITKVDKTDEGDLLVWGKATDASVDADAQIVDLAWSGKALEDWLSTGGNVRVMHSADHLPAGKGVGLDRTDDGHWVRSLVVEPTAKRLVEKGVLQAYSIGISNPQVVRDRVAKGGRIVGGAVYELSLVDRPANKHCGITLVKSAASGTAEEVEELFGEVDAALAEAAKSHKPDHREGDEPDPDASADGDEPGTEDGPDDDTSDDDTSDEGDPDKAAYVAAVKAWQSEEPRLDGAPLSGTAFLAKRASWDSWHTRGETEGLDGTDEGYARWLVKRDMDPNVGGGVDRDKIPAADFVDPERRRFPIVEPGDVSDAARSFGRADPAIPMPRFQERLTAIAHRKGASFVAELPESWDKSDDKQDVATTDLDKSITLTAPDPDGLVPYNLQGADGGRHQHARHQSAAKGMKDCPSCGAEYHADSKLRRCPKCGAKLPKVDATKGGTVSDPDADLSEKGRKPKKGKPFPGAAQPFGSEGGSADDADDDGGDDEPDTDDGASKSAAPYSLWRMHDALCAAYDWDTVAAEYPALKGVADAVDHGWFRAQVAQFATKGDLAQVVALAGTAQSAEVIAKGDLEPALLADARAQVHKSFTDMYPSAHPSPSSVTPGAFHRPYLSAGHSPLSVSGTAGRKPDIPAATHVPDPDDFDRGPLTAGHQAPSPSSTGDNLQTSTVASGASRTYYRNASREAARTAMQAMHDHIVHTFPDMCPMAASRAVMPPDMGDTNRPHPVKPLDVPKAPGEKPAGVDATKAARKAAKLARKAARAAEPALQPAPDITTLVKAAVAEATAGITANYETTIAALKAEIDELGSQPDPTQAPLRGVVRKAATTEPEVPAPVERISLVEQAQAQAAAERDEYVDYLRRLTKSASPATREQAEAQLATFLTKHA